MYSFKEFVLSESKKEDVLFSVYPEAENIVKKKVSPLKVEAGKTYLIASLKVKKGMVMGGSVTLAKVKGFQVIGGPEMAPAMNPKNAELGNKIFNSWKEVQDYFGTKDKKEIVAKVKTEMGDRNAAIGIVADPKDMKNLQSDGSTKPSMEKITRALAAIGNPKATWVPSGILIYET